MLVALLPPLAAFAFEWAFRDYVQPYVWFLFYPAVFLSSWIGGLRGGLIATLLSTVLIWWFFVPPEYTLAKDPRRLFPAGVFFAMGVLIAAFHDRLRQTNTRLARIAAERQLFAALVENSSDFIGIADTHGTPLYVNPAGRRMIGMPPDHPVATTQIIDYYPPDQRELASNVIVRSMVEQGYWQGETYFRHWETQASIPVSDTHFLIRDPDTGATLGMATITRDVSDRKRLERSLRQASADLERAQAVAEVGSWALDVTRNELQWSNETYRLFDIPAGTPMSYEAFLDKVHPEDRATVDARWHAALHGEPYDLEHRIVVDGITRWVREKAELEFDEHGAPLRGIGIVQNVTERRRLEEELRLAEARSSGILSISADAIISIDDLQRITMFNEGAERIFGYSKAEAVGSPLEMLIPERFRAAHRAHVERFATSGTAARRMGMRTLEIFGLRKGGREFPADASISRLEVGGRRILTVSLRDITEQKRVESEHRFFAEVGAILSSTLEYEETLTNIAALAVRELADYAVVDLIGEAGDVRRLEVASRDPAHAWICEALERVPIDPRRPYLTGSVLETLQPALMQHISPEALAEFAQSEAHLAALRAMDPRSAIVVPLVFHGTRLGAIGLVMTGTSRTFGPSDVLLAEELARRAAISIENARLYRAARRAIQSRDDVLGIVAHDLRNPLNSISLHAELLGRQGPGRVRGPTDAIARATRRMNRLIQDLLDVTRMESTQLALERADVPALAVIVESLEAHGPLAAASSIDLRRDAPRDLPDIWADRDRVLQIFENLIGNALKFTPPHGRITVGAAPGVGEVTFWVADTGVGIAPENQIRVFDRFWQERQAERRGAGLGLPIVKGLVEAHGGRIWLESTPGRGSTFYFTIPVSQRYEHRHHTEAHA